MAGAVSAGAYTAGVIDYLLETLHIWEEAKKKNIDIGKGNPGYDESIPMHEVEIDVLSGASAGGITGTLTLLNLLDEHYQHANHRNPEGNNNRFYKSWVQMADNGKGSTLKKMLRLNDIEALSKNEKPESLLNTEAIEEIADNALKTNTHLHRPKYVSDSLDLILTISNLRGINFNIKFDGNAERGTVITSHGGFFRYKTSNEKFERGMPKQKDALYHVLDLKEEKDVDDLKNATLSTAAFPIGLKSRELHILQEYLKRYPKYLFEGRQGIEPILKEGETIYKFNSIDGGLINNEPYGIALKVLEEKNPSIKQDNNYAVIMVDPFPNQDNSTEEVNDKRDMLSIAKGMFKALRNQVMFNQDGILDALSLEDRTKFLIAPKRKVKTADGLKRVDHALASSPLSGFAGFLHRSFREHDFQLGRLNCQSFLRYYFAVKAEDVKNRFGATPSQESFDRFHFTAVQGDSTAPKFFPIIPDLRLKNAFEHTMNEEFGPDALIQYPEYPKFSVSSFEKKYKKALKKRLRTVVKHLSGSGFLTFAYRTFFQGKAYRLIVDTIKDELKEAGLTK